jgi:hypothetical protein
MSNENERTGLLKEIFAKHKKYGLTDEEYKKAVEADTERLKKEGVKMSDEEMDDFYNPHKD